MIHSEEHNRQSPLLRRPGELWNRIYKYALGGNEISPYQVHEDSDYFYLTARPYGTQENDTKASWENLFNLSRTCRQLRHETRMLPYKFNVFSVAWTDDFSDFLRDTNNAKKQAITIVSFGFMDQTKIPVFPVDCTVPKELWKYTGLMTVISIVTLDLAQKKLVEDFAKNRGLKLVIEDQGISDKAMDCDAAWGNFYEAEMEAEMAAWEAGKRSTATNELNYESFHFMPHDRHLLVLRTTSNTSLIPIHVELRPTNRLVSVQPVEQGS